MLKEQLVKNKRTGEYLHAVNIGGIVKYFKNPNGLGRFMKKKGYEYQTVELANGDIAGGWVKVFVGEEEQKMNNQFIKH